MSGAIKIEQIDHLVLTVRDVEATCDFYVRVLHMQAVTFEGRRALRFGQQKINLHPANAPISPHAQHPTPGSADICFISSTPLTEVIAHLKRLGVTLVEGPVCRTGAKGQMTSVYLRDPDSNLVEISEYDHDT